MPFKFGVNSVCQLDRINNVQLNVGTRLSTATIAIASAISFVFFVDDREIFARLLSITSVTSPLCLSAMIIPFNAVIFYVAVSKGSLTNTHAQCNETLRQNRNIFTGNRVIFHSSSTPRQTINDERNFSAQKIRIGNNIQIILV